MRQHHDPIELVHKRLAELGQNDDELKAIDKEIRTIVNEAAQFAQDEPEPDPSELWTDVVASEG